MQDRVRKKHSEVQSIWRKRSRSSWELGVLWLPNRRLQAIKCELLLAAQGSGLNIFPWWKPPANAHSLSQKSFSPFLKRNEWPERMVRLVHQRGQKQVEAASSHEILISMLPASWRYFLIYYHAGAVVQLTQQKILLHFTKSTFEPPNVFIIIFTSG